MFREFQNLFLFFWYSSGTSTLVITLCSLRILVNHCFLGVGKVLFFQCSHARSISEGIFRQDYDVCLVSISLAMASLSEQSIVVGGGLAGMSAADTVLENGVSMLLLDNSSFLRWQFNEGNWRNQRSEHKNVA